MFKSDEAASLLRTI